MKKNNVLILVLSLGNVGLSFAMDPGKRPKPDFSNVPKRSFYSKKEDLEDLKNDLELQEASLRRAYLARNHETFNDRYRGSYREVCDELQTQGGNKYVVASRRRANRMRQRLNQNIDRDTVARRLLD